MKDNTRVGIVVSKIHPNVGGGYTFTNNLLESLLSFSDQKTEISFFVTDRIRKKIIGKSFEKKVIYEN